MWEYIHQMGCSHSQWLLAFDIGFFWVNIGDFCMFGAHLLLLTLKLHFSLFFLLSDRLLKYSLVLDEIACKVWQAENGSTKRYMIFCNTGLTYVSKLHLCVKAVFDLGKILPDTLSMLCSGSFLFLSLLEPPCQPHYNLLVFVEMNLFWW